MAGQSLLHQKGQLIQEFGTVKQIVRTKRESCPDVGGSPRRGSSRPGLSGRKVR